MFAALLVTCSIVPVEHVPEVEVPLVEFNHFERTDGVGFLHCGDRVLLRRFNQANRSFDIADVISEHYVTGPMRSNGRWVILVQTYEGQAVRIIAGDVFSSRTDFDADWTEKQVLPSHERKSFWPFHDWDEDEG